MKDSIHHKCSCGQHDVIDITQQINKVDELLLDVLHQSCGINENEIDNMCISSYEDACNYLESKGLLTTKNGRMYKIKGERK